MWQRISYELITASVAMIASGTQWLHMLRLFSLGEETNAFRIMHEEIAYHRVGTLWDCQSSCYIPSSVTNASWQKGTQSKT